MAFTENGYRRQISHRQLVIPPFSGSEYNEPPVEPREDPAQAEETRRAAIRDTATYIIGGISNGGFNNPAGFSAYFEKLGISDEEAFEAARRESLAGIIKSIKTAIGVERLRRQVQKNGNNSHGNGNK